MALVDVIQNSTNRSINKVHSPAYVLLPQQPALGSFLGGEFPVVHVSRIRKQGPEAGS